MSPTGFEDVWREQSPHVLVALLRRHGDWRNHRLHSAHAHLLELAGHLAQARDAFRLAATLTLSIPEQRYLNQRATR